MSLENNYLRIAKIKSAHSLDGKLKIHVISDIAERFEKGNTVYLKLKEEYKKYVISTFNPMKKRTALLKLEGINDRNSAELLDGVEIFIDKEAAESIRPELDEDSFFYQDIIGCKVKYKGRDFGVVLDIFEGGSGDLLVIEDNNNKTVLIPFVDQMVDTNGISEKTIEINPVEGLLDF
ncbi:MAG TPA: ribosome maturation factor RimM [Spirochaetota bacterium]|nr:ribosome maturation factor RimM [Spirochaetota bacterium]HPS88169.1 ribosome maturation factor RimM [Spirochaetota bacterium]